MSGQNEKPLHPALAVAHLTVPMTLHEDMVQSIFENAPTNLMTTGNGRILCPRCAFSEERSPELFRYACKFNYEAFLPRNLNSPLPELEMALAYRLQQLSGGENQQIGFHDNNRIMHMFRVRANLFGKMNGFGGWEDYLYQELKDVGTHANSAGVAYFLNPPNVLACMNTGEFSNNQHILRTKPCGFSFVPYLKALRKATAAVIPGAPIDGTKGLVDLTKEINVVIPGLPRELHHQWACPQCVVRYNWLREQRKSLPALEGKEEYHNTESLPFFLKSNEEEFVRTEVETMGHWKVYLNSFDRSDEYDAATGKVMIKGIRCSNTIRGSMPEGYELHERNCHYLYGTPLNWDMARTTPYGQRPMAPGYVVEWRDYELDRPRTLDGMDRAGHFAFDEPLLGSTTLRKHLSATATKLKTRELEVYKEVFTKLEPEDEGLARSSQGNWEYKWFIPHLYGKGFLESCQLNM